LQGNSTLFYAKEHKLNNYSRKDQKTTKRKMNRSKQISNTNTKETLFSDSFIIEELEEAINKAKPQKTGWSRKKIP
jgi:ribosome-binding protein aMBF1 (putative translation factor)